MYIYSLNYSKFLLRNTTSVLALEVSTFMTFWTVFYFFIRVISAIILAIAEEPLRNASIICSTWAPVILKNTSC